ncbi:hypothetical protein M5K25_015994 [Dendrobium thyrsiflorum]|uniref:Uncharacterized protein n=1 Tax=Dendrobium thyrsiflorum TaxID=117978 RepID=A0ABD0UYN1_DENTH
MSKLSLIEEEHTWGIERSDRIGRSSHRPGRYVIAQSTMCHRPVRYPRRSIHFVLIVPDDREIILDDQATKKRENFRESFCRSSLSSTCLRVEGKRGRAWEREEEICEGEFVRVFTKVAPSKGSVRLLRASSRIFEDLGGVHFSEKKRFSAGFGWKQKELRFSTGFRRKRKESKVLCLTGLVKRASVPCRCPSLVHFTENFGSLPASPPFRGKLQETGPPATLEKNVYGVAPGSHPIALEKSAYRRFSGPSQTTRLGF